MPKQGVNINKSVNQNVSIQSQSIMMYACAELRQFLYLFIYESYVFIHREALMVPIINCLTSIFAGFVVFSVLGHIALIEHTTVANVTKGGEDITPHRPGRTHHCSKRHKGG